MALTDVMALCLCVEIFRRFLMDFPKADQLFSNQIELQTRMYFIKSVAPFTSIPNQKIKQIASQIEEKFLPSDTTVFEQGDEGSACYIITEGKVEISVHSPNGSPQILTTLGAGHIFGETVLIMDSLRNATARTIEPTTVLKMTKRLFNELTQQQVNAQEALMQLQVRRSRPAKFGDIDVYTQIKGDGSEEIVLRNAKLGKYFQLSEQGLFIWNLLDGDKHR